jgi:hypothetical protein
MRSLDLETNELSYHIASMIRIASNILGFNQLAFFFSNHAGEMHVSIKKESHKG